MNTAAGILLFLVGTFALIFAFLHFPSVEYLTGGAIIALFIAALIYAWSNTIRQTNKLNEKLRQEQEQQQKQSSQAPAQSASS